VQVRWGLDLLAPNLRFQMNVTGGQPGYLKITGDGGMTAPGHFEARSTASVVPPALAESELERCCRYMAPLK
jgi:hypothetical protein